jgi:hypothetical protein
VETISLILSLYIRSRTKLNNGNDTVFPLLYLHLHLFPCRQASSHIFFHALCFTSLKIILVVIRNIINLSFVEKGPAAEATDARSLRAYCVTLVMKMKRKIINYFHFFKLWNTCGFKLTGEN